MPGSIVQASPGGNSPRTINNLHVSNHHPIGGQKDDQQEQEHQGGAQGDPQEHQGDPQEHQQAEGNLEDAAIWVKGSLEEDKRRYKDLMAYMEDKRKEAKELLKEEEERKEMARSKTESWAF